MHLNSHTDSGWHTDDKSKRSYKFITADTVADGSTPLAMKLECMSSWSHLRDEFGSTSDDAIEIANFLVKILGQLWNLQAQCHPDDHSKRYLASTIKYCTALHDGYGQQRGKRGGKQGRRRHHRKSDTTFKPSHPLKGYERLASKSTGQEKRKRF